MAPDEVGSRVRRKEQTSGRVEPPKVQMADDEVRECITVLRSLKIFVGHVEKGVLQDR